MSVTWKVNIDQRPPINLLPSQRSRSCKNSDRVNWHTAVTRAIAHLPRNRQYELLAVHIDWGRRRPHTSAREVGALLAEAVEAAQEAGLALVRWDCPDGITEEQRGRGRGETILTLAAFRSSPRLD
jgi:nucleotide-binding universal stress UspA family protein